MYNKIFISHSSKDAKKAMAICDMLEKNGKKCFIAPRDIKQGEIYAESIVNGIDDSDAVILLLSEGTNDSPHVLREVERAVSKKIPVFAYKIEDVQVSKALEYFTSVNQWVSIESSDDYGRILDALNGNDIGQPAFVNRKKNKKAVISAIAPVILIIAVVIMAFVLAGSRDKKKASPSQTGTSVSAETDSSKEQPAEINLKLGDTIEFGKYNDEPIEWYVLDINDNKATLVTKYIITMKAFDSAEGGKYAYCNDKLFRELDDAEKEKTENQIMAYGSNDFATSNIRTWLNSDRASVEYKDNAPGKASMSELKNAYDSEAGFLYGFSDEEKTAMTTGVTGDMAYLLSRDEVNTLFEKANLRIYTTCTEKAYENDGCKWYNADLYCVDDKDYYWFTRDASEERADKVYIITNGTDPEHVQTVSAGLEGFGIRPAITLDLSKYRPEGK